MTLSTTRGALLAASALLVVFAGPGQAASAHRIAQGAADRSLSVLHDQSKNDSGFGTLSQASSDTFASAAADDFTVSENTVWRVKEIDVTGVYFNGSGSATVDVTFYKNAHHKPGAVKVGGTFTVKSDNSGSLVIDLGKNGIKFNPGHYWLSVAPRQSLGVGEWHWENQTAGTVQGDPAVWQNPGGGLGAGCTTWTVESKCGMGSLGDHMFTLRGDVKIKIK